VAEEVKCNYCNQFADLVTGEIIYPHRKDLADRKFWKCNPCNAYVGCHKPNKIHGFKGNEPLGFLARKRLRYWKMEAHKLLDPIWRNKIMTRTETYQCLADKMGIPLEECHIGYFGLQRTKKAVEVLKETNPNPMRIKESEVRRE